MNKIIKNLMTTCVTILLALSFASFLFLTNNISVVYAEAMADTTWWSEDKTEFEINSAAQFLGLAEIVNSEKDMFDGDTITLKADISLEGIHWIPIGSIDSTKRFKGTFDGENHTISNFKLYDETDYSKLSPYIGLFGYGLRAHIKNLEVKGEIELTNPRTSETESGIGGIIGFLNNGSVENCSFTGTIKSGVRTGGIIGTSFRSTISNCNVVSTENDIISGYRNTGGIVGMMGFAMVGATNVNIVKECSFTGNISGNGSDRVGGIAGSSLVATGSDKEYSQIIDCRVERESTIEGKENVGGIVGVCACDIIHCINNSSVKGQSYVGGIAGIASKLSGYGKGIEQCINNGTVTGADNVSGISPMSNIQVPVFSSYNIGTIISDAKAAGLVCGSTTISDSYNVGNVKGSEGDSYPVSDSSICERVYFDSSLGESTVGEAKTTEEFKNRTVVDLLNGDAEEPVWFQNVDYPDFAGNMTPVEEITVDKTTEVGIGKEVDIKAVLTPDDATNKGLIFTSSDEEIATVTADGKVSGKKVGEADITVMALYDGSKAVCKVTVKDLDKEAAQKVIDEIKAIDPSKATLEELEAIQKKYDALTPEQKAIVDADSDASAAKKAIDAKVEELEKAKKDDQQTTVAVKNGAVFTVKGYKYTVTSNLKNNPTVKITGYKNKKLKKITVPATVTYNKVAFKVTEIGKGAFKNQKKATSAVVGKNVDTIGASAFAGDAKLKKITVKSAVVKKVGAKALKGINKKAVIKVPAKSLKAYKKLFKGKGQKKTVKIKK